MGGHHRPEPQGTWGELQASPCSCRSSSRCLRKADGTPTRQGPALLPLPQSCTRGGQRGQEAAARTLHRGAARPIRHTAGQSSPRAVRGPIRGKQAPSWPLWAASIVCPMPCWAATTRGHLTQSRAEIFLVMWPHYTPFTIHFSNSPFGWGCRRPHAKKARHHRGWRGGPTSSNAPASQVKGRTEPTSGRTKTQDAQLRPSVRAVTVTRRTHAECHPGQSCWGSSCSARWSRGDRRTWGELKAKTGGPRGWERPVGLGLHLAAAETLPTHQPSPRLSQAA